MGGASCPESRRNRPHPVTGAGRTAGGLECGAARTAREDRATTTTDGPQGPPPEGSPAHRHRRATELFLALAERSAEARAAALADAERRDPELAREVERLLAADAAGTVSLLDRPAASLLAAAAPVAETAEVRGDRAYRLISEIGRGGMGSVWLAERADGEYRQRVAIKLVLGGPGALRQVLARFRTERQILASLDHPFVARLLDGGTTADGVPFLVMEHVEGERIDHFCERRGLDAAGRLRLFLKVCAAVSAAHRRLVVHRDLKPANILVTAEGDPKLLDFGIAKLLEPAAAGVTVAETVSGVSPLTPRYASPEQMRGEPITTSTDVYSLGVVLYELLAGRPPYREESLAPHRLPQAICEEEPTPPSTRPRGDGAATLESRAPFPQPRIDRDLDAIVLKALRKEPAARYASVEAFADDVERFLDGRPVAARRGSAAYRAAKFVRRNWLALAAVAGFAALLLGWSLTLRAQLARVERERDRSQRTRDLLVEIFGGADPYSPKSNRTLSTVEALDRAVPQIRERLASEPELRASLLTSIGYLYTTLGALDAADPILAEAVALGREDASADPGEHAKALRALGWLRFQQGKAAEADELYLSALALVPGPPADPSREHAVLMVERSPILSALARHEDAERTVRAGLDELRSLPSIDERDIAFAQTHLANVLIVTWRGPEAEALLSSNLETFRRIGANPVRQAAAANLLGSLRYSQGDFAAAEQRFAEAHELYVRELGERHPRSVEVLNNLGLVVFARGDYRRATALLERNATLFAEILGEDHFDVATARANLGLALALAGEPERGERILRAALERHVSQRGEMGEVVAYDLWMLSLVRFYRGDLAEALALGRRCQAAARGALPEENPQVAACDGASGAAARWTGNVTAESDLARCIATQRKILPVEHVDRVSPLAEYASLLAGRGDSSAALPIALEATEVARATLPRGHWEIAWADAVLGVVRLSLGGGEEDRRAVRAALPVLESRFGRDHPRVRWAAAQLERRR